MGKIIKNEVLKKLADIDKEVDRGAREKENNENYGWRIRIQLKKIELEKETDDDRIYNLKKEVKSFEYIIELNSKKIKEDAEKERLLRKLEVLKKPINEKLDYYKNAKEKAEETIKIKEKEANELLSSLTVEETEKLDKLRKISKELKRQREIIENLEYNISLIENALREKDINELINIFNFKTNKELIVKLGKDDYSKSYKTNNSLEEARKLVDALKGNGLTRENFKKAKDAVMKLEDTAEKAELVKLLDDYYLKLFELEEASKNNELKESIENTLQEIEKTLIDKKDIITTNDINELNGKLNTVSDNIMKLTDGSDAVFEERVNCIKFDLGYHECRIIVKDSASFEDKKDILHEKIEKLIDTFESLNEENKNNRKNILNTIIMYYNKEGQYLYQQELYSNDNQEKYSFFTKFSEFVAGGLFNKITSSKLYKKFFERKLKKAEEKNNDEKIEKYSNKISDIGIINGVRLFVNRNKIAKLKPKLYKENIMVSDKDKNKYDKSIQYISDKMTGKLYEYSTDNDKINNKDIVTNIILQYIDTIALSNEYSEIVNKAEEFISDSFNSGILSDAECRAYIQEIENIVSYRGSFDNNPYEVNENEINDMIVYCDNSPLSENIKYLKK